MALSRKQLRARYRFLPGPLFDTFFDEWVKAGDTEVALAKMRESGQYEKHFPNNKLPDGRLRYNENQYLSLMDDYKNSIRRAGINPNVFNKLYPQLIEGLVSPAEFSQRINTIEQRVLSQSATVKKAFAQQMGIKLSSQAILAAAIHPSVQAGLLDRSITIAEIAASGRDRGLNVTIGQARRLTNLGFEQQQAGGLFDQAAQFVPTLDVFAQRHMDPNEDFNLGDFISAFAGADRDEQQRISRLFAQEAALFTGQSGAARTGEAVSGLTPR